MRALTTLSGLAAVVLTCLVPGCVASAGTEDDEGALGATETCDEGVRNDEWDVDCSAACNHVIACKATSSDSDLEALTCNDCLGSCLAGVELGGNDIAESTEENRRSWECAALVEGCSSLDHNCDLF